MDMVVILGIIVTCVAVGIATLYDTSKKEGKLNIRVYGRTGAGKLRRIAQMTKLFSLTSKLKRENKESKLQKIAKGYLKVVKTRDFLNLAKNIKNLWKIKVVFPSKFLKSNKETELKNIESGLAKVVNGTPVSREKTSMDDSEVKKFVEEKLDDFEVSEGLLNEMETAERINEEENKLDTNSEYGLNSDIVVDTEDLDFGISAEEDELNGEIDVFGEGDLEIPEDISVDFDEQDALISSLQKEISVRKEEKIDLLRDLRGEKLEVHELKKELEELLAMLQSFSKNA